MKSINVNKLQANISEVIRECQCGEVYSIMRYSKPVAYLISRKEYDKLQHKDCERCLSEIREVARLAKKQTKNKKSGL